MPKNIKLAKEAEELTASKSDAGALGSSNASITSPRIISSLIHLSLFGSFAFKSSLYIYCKSSITLSSIVEPFRS
jgi:hypothetical protein